MEQEFLELLFSHLTGSKDKALLQSLIAGMSVAQQSLLKGDMAQLCVQLNQLLGRVRPELMETEPRKLYRNLIERYLSSSKISIEQQQLDGRGKLEIGKPKGDMVLTTTEQIYAVELMLLSEEELAASTTQKLLTKGKRQLTAHGFPDKLIAPSPWHITRLSSTCEQGILDEDNPVETIADHDTIVKTSGVVLLINASKQQIVAWRTYHHSGNKQQEGEIPLL